MSSCKRNLFFIAQLLIFQFAFSQDKSGICPQNIHVPICSHLCFYDQECRGDTKCCRTSCGGSVCATPVKEVELQKEGKFGFCPDPPTGPWVCSSRCFADSDCRGKKKCCANRCGAMACVNPEIPY